MTLNDLKVSLQQPYQSATWRSIIKDLLPQTLFLATTQPLFEQVEFVEKAFQFGSVTLADDKRLGLIDVQLTDIKNISKNRVELRNLAAKLIDGQFEGLLVWFHSANAKQQNYRLTFIAKSSSFSDEGEFIKQETAPKRYSFLLGPKESCTTAAIRILELKEKASDKIGLRAIIEAFSVEKLNKEFFKGYKEHYEKFWRYLNAQTEYRNVLIVEALHATPLQEKPIRDFAKKLLGRIVFLYFLQKKGWLGSPPPPEGGVLSWGNGDPNFIKNLFADYPQKQLFYSKCLTQLFFETLNTKREGHLFTPIGGQGAAGLVPYLNGGLFDNDLPETNHFDFPENYFADLFNFFDQYNFTIDENSPDDANVGIDPEMLGHIFENLLEENKDKGAFYTPKAIVQYMCQESLIQYLSPLTPDGGTDLEAIQKFIHHNDRGDAKGFVAKNARRIEQLLDNVKICDPAIGSGAFPMGMLHEIFKAKIALDWTLDPAEVKRHIIQNSIYGVDLDRGAVDIARLRFWLALVVDEDTPSPLPNLDYKIMQGNSLLESFEGIPLNNLQQTKTIVTVFETGKQIDMFGTVAPVSTELLDTKRQDLDQLINTYFDADSQQKASIKSQINAIVHEHLHYNVDLKLAEVQTKIANLDHEISLISIGDNDPKAKREQKQKALNTKQKALENLQTEAQRLENALTTLDRIQETNERPYFLWHLFFKDVFGPLTPDGGIKSSGFDIVIGNPPYIQLQNDGGYLAKLFEGENYTTFERTGDIYALFYEKGIQCLKPNGVLCYITSNKWMRAGYGESLRKFFAQKTNPIALIDFAGQRIFENATVDTNILLAQKAPNQGSTQACLIKEKWQSSLAGYVAQHQATCQFQTADSWVILSPIEQRIRQKIERIGTPLKDWDIKINYGIKTGYNEAFIIDGKKKDELIAADPKSAEIIRPILRGRDIKRYGYEFADLWIIATFPSLNYDIESYPAVKQHLLSFGYDRLKQTGDIGARKKTNNEWFETQDSISYWDDFFKPKIVWAELARTGNAFTFDDASYILSNTGYILVIDPDKEIYYEYLLAFLNSRAMLFYLDMISTRLDETGWRWLRQYVELLPIPILPKEQQSVICNNVQSELKCKTITGQNEINLFVNQIFTFTNDEIEYLEINTK